MICPYCNKQINSQHQIIHLKGNVLIGCPEYSDKNTITVIYKDNK